MYTKSKIIDKIVKSYCTPVHLNHRSRNVVVCTTHLYVSVVKTRIIYVGLRLLLTFWTASWAASRVVNVTNAYPLLVPVMGSIISLRSQMVPHASNSGISSSSYMSFGILPQNTSHPDPGDGPSHPGGGPPYFL